MSKYSFDRITPDAFESLAQALLEKTYRVGGELIQFGPGADGGREATWSQPVTHPDYRRPCNEQFDIQKEWVFQVKYHDIGQRGWSAARDAVVEDLEKELDKIVNKHRVPCHAYVMITNVPFTGVRDLGTRDKISAVAQDWKDDIPEIFVWDAADISRLLDANESVRTAYLDTILPGDLIKAICKGATFHADRTRSALWAYLKFVTEREGVARAEEAGDEPGLPLVDVFVDLTMRPQHSPFWDIERGSTKISLKNSSNETRFLPIDYAKTPSSFALLIADYHRTLLLGGPGLGKSTLTQFAAIYHAARLVDSSLSRKLANRLKLPEGFTAEHLDAHCQLRFPFRIELRRYARWMGEEQKNGRAGEIARYIVEMLINPNVSSLLGMDDIFALAASDPILLILDGLDEVPHPEARQQILENIHIFLRRVQAEHGDIQLLFSSRPKGYSGEFNVFEPYSWELNNLDRSDFNAYCDSWIRKRIRDATEIIEARERIDRGMKSEAVQRLAQSLLQATVMLTIVRRKNEIPHQRHALYAKYVEVIFDREKEKSPIVRDHEVVLNRLHERVGFELHRKMDQTSIEALDSDSFRTYVLKVLEDYSGEDLGSKKLREVADDIIIASTDRLCLLVGKGKDQTDIDFVVQSYREYFASVYLFNHPDADPDKVFQVLVRRGGYWANVLQFYVAQANANQQMRWVLSADGDNINVGSTDDIVDLIRTRRSLVNMLPEFNLQRNSDFDRALRIIFKADTRWIWLQQELALELLSVLRAGSARKTLTDLFKLPSVTDKGALAAELWFLSGLYHYDSPELKDTCEQIEKLIDQPDVNDVAMATILSRGLIVNLTSSSLSTFSKPWVCDEDISVKLFSSQCPVIQCELLLEGFIPRKMPPQSPSYLASSIYNALIVNIDMKLFNGNVTLKFSPYLCRSRDSLTTMPKVREEIPFSGNQTGEYFRSLLDAAHDPTNQDLDLKVRILEQSLDEEHLGIWEPDNVLGPSVDKFTSLIEWKSFKNELVDIVTDGPNWLHELQQLPDLDSAWAVLLFHPVDWSFLVDEKLLSEASYAMLMISPFGKINSIPKVPLNLIQVISFNSDIQYKIHLNKVMNVALNIVEKKGVDRIGSGWIVSALLSHGGVQPITKDEAELLIKRVLDCPPLPSGWSAAVLRLCVETSCDSSLLVKLWHHVTPPRKLHFVMPSQNLTKEMNELVSKLLDVNQPDALQLVTRILSDGRSQSEIVSRLITYLLNIPSTDKYENYARIRAMLSQLPSLDEFNYWAKWDTTAANGFGEYPWLFKKLLERFDEAIKRENQLNPAQLRARFAPFIVRRSGFPWQIPCAALEAILKLDEQDVEPLRDSEWQQACLNS